MKSKTKISIPKSCQENWLELDKDEKQRFCNLCQKNVFDETNSSNDEIVCLKYNTLLKEIENKNKHSFFRKLAKLILKNRAK